MIGGVILAAGASRRAGRIKALAPRNGRPFVACIADALRDGGCHERVLVVGSPHADAIAAAMDGATRVDNPAPERGMLSSLQLGLRDRWDAAVVALVDHPRVEARTVRVLIDAWTRTGAEVIRPRYRGQTGHPYLVSAALFDALRAANPRYGPRALYRSRVRHAVDVDDPGVLDDLDTAEAVASVADPSGAPGSTLR